MTETNLHTFRAFVVFMEAGEFKDYKNETEMNIFRGVVSPIRGDRSPRWTGTPERLTPSEFSASQEKTGH